MANILLDFNICIILMNYKSQSHGAYCRDLVIISNKSYKKKNLLKKELF